MLQMRADVILIESVLYLLDITLVTVRRRHCNPSKPAENIFIFQNWGCCWGDHAMIRLRWPYHTWHQSTGSCSVTPPGPLPPSQPWLCWRLTNLYNFNNFRDEGTWSVPAIILRPNCGFGSGPKSNVFYDGHRQWKMSFILLKILDRWSKVESIWWRCQLVVIWTNHLNWPPKASLSWWTLKYFLGQI